MTFKNFRRIPRALLFMLVSDRAARRQLRAWLRSLSSGRDPLADERPLVTFEAADWLEQTLRSDMKVFEWGSGASTLFFARRAGEITSVEHDTKWHHLLEAALKERAISNCRYILAEPEHASSGAGGAEADPFVSTRRRYAGASFERYVKVIDEYPDGYFDLVLVDGRQRVACGERAIKKLRPGGHVVLDNSERADYDPLRRLLATQPVREFYGIGPGQAKPWRTSVWEIR